MAGIHEGVASRGVPSVRGGQDRGIDGSGGAPHAALSLQTAHGFAQLGVDQPIARRHWPAVVEERGVLDNSRHGVATADGNSERARRFAAEETGDGLEVGRIHHVVSARIQ